MPAEKANREKAVAPGSPLLNDNTVDIIVNNNPYPSIGISEAPGELLSLNSPNAAYGSAPWGPLMMSLPTR